MSDSCPGLRLPRRAWQAAFVIATGLGIVQTALAQDVENGQPRPAAKITRPRAQAPKQRLENLPALITADRVIQDHDLNTVTASGHVEIDQGGRVLLADTLSYNLTQDVIIAAGHVVLTELSGDVTFADYIELSGDMKQMVANRIHLLLSDDSRIIAASERSNGTDKRVIDKAFYTPYPSDPNNPQKTPLWGISSARVIHDETAHQIRYYNSWFDADGLPTVYWPYFSIADPSVKRESGVLSPSIINNHIVGFGASFPYFQVLGPSEDVTLNPLITENYGPAMSAMYRWRGESGEIKTITSVAGEPNNGSLVNSTTGWHVNSKAQFDLDPTWRYGWNVYQASDKDYLRYYDYHIPQPFLTTHPYVEGFGYRSYAAIEAYSFQSQSDIPTLLAPGEPNKAPYILPLITYSVMSEPGALGGYWTFDTHAASIARADDEQDSRRINSLTAWHRPFVAEDGEYYTLTTSLRADFYNTEHLLNPYTGTVVDGTVNATRLLPAATLDWRYPLAKVGSETSQTISPIIVASASPYNGDNSYKIPNEDSLDFELDDMNILSPTPFSGYDRVFSGPHVAYGGEYNVTRRGAQLGDVLLGQIYQPHPQTIFQPGTGLDGQFSDYAGRIEADPSPDLTLDYRFRVDKQNFGMRRSEVNALIGPAPMRLTLTYVFFGQLNPDSPFAEREQVSGTLAMQLDQNWQVQLYDNSNLGPRSGPLQTGFRVVYEDEGLLVTLDAGERHTTINTFYAGHYAILSVNLKTLAQFPVSLIP
jgi:LPS-assembly protein